MLLPVLFDYTSSRDLPHTDNECLVTSWQQQRNACDSFSCLWGKGSHHQVAAFN